MDYYFHRHKVMEPSSITIWTMLASLKEAFIAKAFFASVLSGIAYILGMTEAMALVMFALMLIDLITGITAAVKVRHEHITSKGLWTTGRKMTLFFTMMATTALMTLFNPYFNIIHVFCINYVAASEGISILENLSALGLKEARVVVDKIKELTKSKTKK